MVDNPAVTGGGIDYRAAAGRDSHVSGYNHDVAGLDVGEVIDPGIPAHIAPAGGGDVALIYPYLIQTPVYESGTVKGIWTFCSPHIGRSYL